MWPKIAYDSDGYMLAASHAIGRNAVIDEAVTQPWCAPLAAHLGAGVLSAAVVASYAVARGDWLGAGLAIALLLVLGFSFKDKLFYASDWTVDAVPGYGAQRRANPLLIAIALGRVDGAIAAPDRLAPAHLGERPRKKRPKRRIGFRASRGERHQMRDSVDDSVDRRRASIDDPVGPLRNRLEHRLHVRRRAGNDLQDVGRGGGDGRRNAQTMIDERAHEAREQSRIAQHRCLLERLDGEGALHLRGSGAPGQGGLEYRGRSLC
mgnify:CR=1 FL=1